MNREYKIGERLFSKNYKSYIVTIKDKRKIGGGFTEYLVKDNKNLFVWKRESVLDSHYIKVAIDCSKLWKEINQ